MKVPYSLPPEQTSPARAQHAVAPLGDRDGFATIDLQAGLSAELRQVARAARPRDDSDRPRRPVRLRSQ